jgi:hypothetical protein
MFDRLLNIGAQGIEWHQDPAASGPRVRAFISVWAELIVYDDGNWEVRLRGETKAYGQEESNGEDALMKARRRAVIAYAALTCDV